MTDTLLLGQTLLTFRHILIQVRVRLIRDSAESVGVMLL